MNLAGAIKAAGEIVQQWSSLIIGIVALVAILGGRAAPAAFGRWRDDVWSALTKPFTSGARSEAALVKFRADATDKWAEILAELRPNGGASLKDAVLRIEDRQVRMGGRLDMVLLALEDAGAVYETDEEGLCIWVSPAYCRLVGRTLEETLGWGWVMHIWPADVDRVRQEWRLAVEEHRSFEMRFRMTGADGRVISVLSRATPLKVGPRVVGWSGLLNVEDSPV